jgi:hypothetical protein
VAVPRLGSLHGEDEGVEGFRAEQLVRFGRWGCGGERARAHQSWQWQWHWVFLLGENERGRGKVVAKAASWCSCGAP